MKTVGLVNSLFLVRDVEMKTCWEALFPVCCLLVHILSDVVSVQNLCVITFCLKRPILALISAPSFYCASICPHSSL